MTRSILAISLALSFAATVFFLDSSGSARVAKADDLNIVEPWARATIGKARSGVVYMTVVNKGLQNDRIVRLETPVARKAELHDHEMKDGVMRMRPTGPLEIAKQSTAQMKPGGLHVMLMGLNEALKEGETFPLTVTFEKAGTVTTTVAVQSFTAKHAKHEHGGMKHDAGSMHHGDAKMGQHGHGKSSMKAGKAMHGHHGAQHKSVEVSKAAAPEISIMVTQDSVGGWNLHVMTKNFRFAPGNVNKPHLEGEGHAHLMVNGTKIARLYGPWFHIGKLPAGENRIAVGLYSNDHRVYTVDGMSVSAETVIVTPGS